MHLPYATMQLLTNWKKKLQKRFKKLKKKSDSCKEKKKQEYLKRLKKGKKILEIIVKKLMKSNKMKDY